MEQNNKIKLSIAIQHCPTEERVRMKNNLLEQLDHDPRIKVVAQGDLWNNCKACLRSADPDATHILVLQDDIEVCKDFLATVEKAVELRPNNHITFFTNRNDDLTKALNEGKRWVRIKRWLMAQAYVVPVSMVEPFINFADNYLTPEVKFDDDRWCIYHLYTRTYVWATAPTLVQHLAWGETTIADLYGDDWKYVKEASNRISEVYLGRERSGLDIDFSKVDDYVADQKGHILMYKHMMKLDSLYCAEQGDY